MFLDEIYFMFANHEVSSNCLGFLSIQKCLFPQERFQPLWSFCIHQISCHYIWTLFINEIQPINRGIYSFIKIKYHPRTWIAWVYFYISKRFHWVHQFHLSLRWMMIHSCTFISFDGHKSHIILYKLQTQKKSYKQISSTFKSLQIAINMLLKKTLQRLA